MVLQTNDSGFPRVVDRFDSATGEFRGQSDAETEAFVGLAAGPDGNAYVVSNVLGSATIYVFAGDGSFVRAVAGWYNLPGDITFGPDGKIYAVAMLNWNDGEYEYGVIKIDPTTGEQSGPFLSTGNDYQDQLRHPTFGPDGHFYGVNQQGVVRYHGTSGAFVDVFIPIGRGGLAQPTALTFGKNGDVYVASSASHSILRYTSNGTFAGTFVPPGDGGLNGPADLAFGPDGDLYVASSGSNAILRFAPNGAFRSTFASGPAVAEPREIAFATSKRTDVPWVDDALPSGAQGYATGGDAWNWVGRSSPDALTWPRFGEFLHQSNSSPTLHEHFFNFAKPFPIGTGDVLYAWVYVHDEPLEIMLSWKDDLNWEHRAYWGRNAINAGKDGTDSRRHMGAIPYSEILRGWARLEIPARLVGLEGKNLRGMSFSLYSGQVAWDVAGKVSISSENPSTPAPPPPPPPPPDESFVVWFDDGFPPGAQGGFRGSAPWTWKTASPAAPGASALALHSTSDAGMHEQYFNFASQTLTLAAGEKVAISMYIDPANPPKQIVLSFCANRNWEHRAYWGDAIMRYAVDGSAGQKRIGNIPAGGAWVQLEIPAEAVNLVGQPISGMSFTLFDGRVVFDRIGKN